MIAHSRPWTLFAVIVLMAPLAAYARNGMALMPFILAAIILFQYGFSGLYSFDKFVLVPTFLLFAWGLISAIWGESSEIDKAPILALTAFVGAVVVLSPKKMSNDDIKHYSKAICIFGIASAIIFSIQFIFDFPILRLVSHGLVPIGSQGNITPLALLVYPVGVALFLERRSKTIGFMFVVIMLIVVSLGPMFAAAAAVYVATIIFIASYFFPRLFIAILFSTLIIYIITSPLLHKEFVTIEQSHRLPISLEQTWIHRLGMWTFASGVIAEHPILGVGLRGSRYLGKGQVVEGTELPVMSLHPHNAALEVWLELGAVGVLLVIGICLGVARLLWRLRHERLLIAMSCASIATFTLISLLSFGLWQLWWQGTIWVTAFIVSLMRRRLNVAGRELGRTSVA